MTTPPGRRERKKALTRKRIAETAIRLFLDRGYDAVGLREVASEADVAVTTIFSHFASKEALVFEQDEDFERRLIAAATGRAPGQPLMPALRDEVQALVRHCTADGTVPIWDMINGSAALREYEESMRLRHAESLARALDGLSLPKTTTACRTISRFVIDAYSLAREADDPAAAVDEIFGMIEAAWAAAGAS